MVRGGFAKKRDFWFYFWFFSVFIIIYIQFLANSFLEIDFSA